MELNLNKLNLLIIILLSLSCLLYSNLYAQTGPFSDYDFGCDIDLGVTIAGTPIPPFLPSEGNIDWGSHEGEALPLSIEVIDEESNVLRVTIGEENRSQVSFTVSPEGLYDAEGIFRDQNYSFEFGEGQFSVSVEDNNSELSFRIKENSGTNVIFRKDFDWENFGLSGEFEVEIDSEGPSFIFKINNPDHLGLEVEASSQEVDLSGTIDLGTIGLGVRSVSRKDGQLSLEGDLDWEIGGGYQISLSLGDVPSLEITREDVEDARNSLLEDSGVSKEVTESYGDMNEQEICDFIDGMLGDLLTGEGGDALADLVDGSSLDELEKIPESLSFFLALGNNPDVGGKIMEIVMPLVARKLALELSLDQEGAEAKLIFSFNQLRAADGVEHGIIGIAVQRSEDDTRGIFTVADSQGICSAEVITSFAHGLEKVYLKAERDGMLASLGIDRTGYALNLRLDDSVLGIGVDLAFGSKGFGYVGINVPDPFGLGGDIEFGYKDEEGYIGYIWGDRNIDGEYLELRLGSKITLDFRLSFGKSE